MKKLLMMSVLFAFLFAVALPASAQKPDQTILVEVGVMVAPQEDGNMHCAAFVRSNEVIGGEVLDGMYLAGSDAADFVSLAPFIWESSYDLPQADQNISGETWEWTFTVPTEEWAHLRFLPTDSPLASRNPHTGIHNTYIYFQASQAKFAAWCHYNPDNHDGYQVEIALPTGVIMSSNFDKLLLTFIVRNADGIWWYEQ